MAYLAKFLDEREAMQLHQTIAFNEEVLLKYLRRSRETVVKDLLASQGEQMVRLQGAAQMLDELLDKLSSARDTADKLEKARKGR